MKEKLRWFFKSFIWLFVLLLVIDIVTKLVVMFNMKLGDSITLIPGFLKITLVYNANAAFGMGFASPEVNRWLYIVIAILGAGIILYFYIKKYQKLNMFIKACLMMMLTGAIGNLIDRLFYAKSNYCVVDWINFFDNDFWHWVFNIADSAIVVGTIMLLIYFIVDEVKEYKANKAKEVPVEGKVLSKVEKEKIDHLNEEEKVDN